MQVALDEGFNNITDCITKVRGHAATRRRSRSANDQFWWRVRAVDLAGQPTPWTDLALGFQRQWLDQPQPSTRWHAERPGP